MPAASGIIKNEINPCPLCGSLVFKPALECEDFSFVRCVSCGLVQRNPQPGKDEVLMRYQVSFGNDYLSYELENEAAFLKLQQLALKDAGFYKLEKDIFSCFRKSSAGMDDSNNAPSILDVGCATGALLASFCTHETSGQKSSPEWRVTGVEISPCAFYAQNERGLNVYNKPLEEINFPGCSFDVILASHLIEHLNDPAVFLHECRRILKDNGHIFITTPNISGFQARLYGRLWRSAIFDHICLFSRRTLSKMMKKNGFKTESCRTWGGLAAGTASPLIKKTADFLAKKLNCGDVMIIRAVKTA